MRLFVKAGFFVLTFFFFLVGCFQTPAIPGLLADSAKQGKPNPSSSSESAKKLEPTPPTVTIQQVTPAPKSEIPSNHPTPSQPTKGNQTSSADHLVIFHGPRSEKKVALTFDDGPDRHYTNLILDILKREQVSATFFVVGRRVQRCPDMLQRIDQEGHVIGNHSWNHSEWTQLSKEKIRFQIEHTNEVIKQVVGKEPVLLRPPYGSIDQRLAKRLNQKGFKVIHWSIDTSDWRKRTPDAIVQTVKKQMKPGAIILQHNAGGPQLKSTVEALPDIIAYLKRHQYEFVTVDELLDIAPYR